MRESKSYRERIELIIDNKHDNNNKNNRIRWSKRGQLLLLLLLFNHYNIIGQYIGGIGGGVWVT